MPLKPCLNWLRRGPQAHPGTWAALAIFLPTLIDTLQVHQGQTAAAMAFQSGALWLKSPNLSPQYTVHKPGECLPWPRRAMSGHVGGMVRKTYFLLSKQAHSELRGPNGQATAAVQSRAQRHLKLALQLDSNSKAPLFILTWRGSQL